MPSPQHDYERRINRVLDHIHEHLGDPLSLEELSRIACFSRFHFHRIFTAMVGEPVYAYVRRLRLERAAQVLVTDPRQPVLDVALDAGFSSQAAFTRAFRDHHGCSPTSWRQSKIGTTERNEGQGLRTRGQRVSAPSGYSSDVLPDDRVGASQEEPMSVRLETLPARHVIYVRRIGPYSQAAHEAWGALCAFAGPRGLLREGSTWLSVSHDDPSVTEHDRLRYDACLEVEGDVEVEGAVGRRTIPGGQYAILRYHGPVEQVGEGWSQLCGEWLPGSGYKPADHPGYEVYVEPPAEEPPHVSTIDICIPVVPL